MKKDELLRKLQEALNTEESATTIYLKHLDAITTRFNIGEKFIEEARRIIDLLIKGNLHHKEECEKMIKMVKESDREEY